MTWLVSRSMDKCGYNKFILSNLHSLKGSHLSFHNSQNSDKAY